MTCAEVKFSLHDFFDGLLDLYMKRNIEEHMRSCDNCYAEYLKLNNFFNKLKDMPYAAELPKGIIETLSQELMTMSFVDSAVKLNDSKVSTKKIRRELEKQSKMLKHASGAVTKSKISKTMLGIESRKKTSPKLSNKIGKFFLTLLPAAIIAAGYYIYDYQKFNSPWEIKTIKGNVLINGSLNRFNKIHQGENLSTEDNSSAVLNVPGVGSISIEPNANIILERGKEGDNKIKLKLGTIKVVNKNYLPSLSIGIGNCSIIDKSGEFYVTVAQNGEGKVIVDYGTAEINYMEENIFLSSGYSIEIKNNSIPGTPYRTTSSEELKKVVHAFDNEEIGEDAVEQIIQLAKEEDALTLIALIPRTSQLKRQLLYQAIANFFPPPELITRMGIIRGDAQMIFLWWQDIEWQL